MIDGYSIKARLWPALLSVLPAAGIVPVLFPGIDAMRAGALGASTAAGLTFLMAQLARSAGKKREPELFRLWGGKPTCVYLRHRTSPLDPITLGRYHSQIRGICPGLVLPDRAGEDRDPAAADAAYEAATRVLIGKTRDQKRFSLLYKENTHYGFCRNLWGLKRIGLTVALCASAAALGVGVADWVLRSELNLAAMVTGVLCTAWALLWVFWLTADWVRVAANSYSERLLEASDQLSADANHSGPV